MIPVIETKRKKGKNGGALKKSRKVLAALVNAQLKINRQQGINLIKPPSDPNEQYTYYGPNPKGTPTPMPAITQDYEDDDTLDPKISYRDDQWEEEAAEKILSNHSVLCKLLILCLVLQHEFHRQHLMRSCVTHTCRSYNKVWQIMLTPSDSRR